MLGGRTRTRAARASQRGRRQSPVAGRHRDPPLPADALPQAPARIGLSAGTAPRQCACPGSGAARVTHRFFPPPGPGCDTGTRTSPRPRGSAPVRGESMRSPTARTSRVSQRRRQQQAAAAAATSGSQRGRAHMQQAAGGPTQPASAPASLSASPRLRGPPPPTAARSLSPSHHPCLPPASPRPTNAPSALHVDAHACPGCACAGTCPRPRPPLSPPAPPSRPLLRHPAPRHPRQQAAPARQPPCQQAPLWRRRRRHPCRRLCRPPRPRGPP